MSDEKIIEYVRYIVLNNLNHNGFTKECAYVMNDETNRLLLEHIKGLIALFEKAKEILEKGGDKDEPR